MERLTYVTEEGEVLFHPAELPDDEGVTITQLAKAGRYKELKQIAERLANREQAEENGLLLRLPCKIGDVVYIIGECFAIPNQLDGTLYDSDGGPGTATGYYCPYEGKCPHDNEDFAGCDVCVNKKAVFEDIAKSIWIDEDGMHVCGEETTICADIGDTVFLTREEAEAKLAEMEGNHE